MSETEIREQLSAQTKDNDVRSSRGGRVSRGFGKIPCLVAASGLWWSSVQESAIRQPSVDTLRSPQRRRRPSHSHTKINRSHLCAHLCISKVFGYLVWLLPDCLPLCLTLPYTDRPTCFSLVVVAVRGKIHCGAACEESNQQPASQSSERTSELAEPSD